MLTNDIVSFEQPGPGHLLELMSEIFHNNKTSIHDPISLNTQGQSEWVHHNDFPSFLWLQVYFPSHNCPSQMGYTLKEKNFLPKQQLFPLKVDIHWERRLNKNGKVVSSESVQVFLLWYSMNYRDFPVKSKLIISLFQTVKLSL